VDSFLDYVEDLKLFISHIKEINNEKPLILYGHSMGGSIAARYALTYQDDIDALVLSSPAFKPIVTKSKFMQMIAPVLSMIAPPFSLNSELDPEKISHDADVVSAYKSDELVHDQITLKCWDEFTKNNDNCLDRSMEIQLPVFIMHGTEDGIADVEGSKLFFERISSTDKQLELCDGCYHEVLNEEKSLRAKAINALTKWILAHIKYEPKPEGRKSPLASVSAVSAPEKKAAAPKAAKSPSPKKAVAKKAAAKKAVAKKVVAKKVVAKKAAAKKAAPKSAKAPKAAKKAVKKAAKKK